MNDKKYCKVIIGNKRISW